MIIQGFHYPSISSNDHGARGNNRLRSDSDKEASSISVSYSRVTNYSEAYMSLSTREKKHQSSRLFCSFMTHTMNLIIDTTIR